MSAAAKTDSNQVYIGLGSNIDPEQNLRVAVEALRQSAQLKALSHAWRSAAVGSAGPEFLNAAACLETPLDPAALKARVLVPIEQALGRVRTADPNAPRTIDLDILVVNQSVLDEDIWRYAHLAVPLGELCPLLTQPDGTHTLQAIAERLRASTDIQPVPGLWS